MWKKFLAVMALVGIMSQTAMAAGWVDGDPEPTSLLITSAEVTPDINPGEGETAVVTLSVSQDVYAYAKLLDSNYDDAGSVFPSQELTAGDHTLIYDGLKADGVTPVADGDYTVHIVAMAVDQSSHQVEDLDLTVTSTSVGDLTVTKFDLSVSAYNPTLGDLVVSYKVSKIADVEVFITDDSSSEVAKMTADNASEGDLTWDGKDALGLIVAEGNYKATLRAASGADSVTESVNFSVSYDATAGAPDVTSLTVDPITFAPSQETTDISFSVNEGAYLTVVVKSGDVVVREWDTYKGDWYNSGVQTLYWNGKDTSGDYLENGTYNVEVTATNDAGTDIETTFAIIDYSDSVMDSDIIKNVYADPNPWDPSSEELDIEWELAEDVDEFLLTADGYELWEDEAMDADDYELSWDGLDDDDDYPKEGLLELKFKADSDTLSYFVVVEYEEPEVSDAFVTKTSFDSSIDEFVYVVFYLDQDAQVTVEVKDGNKTEETLVDEEEYEGKKWHAVKWDGTNKKGKMSDEDDYKFQITAANLVNDDVKSIEYAEVTIEEDEVSSGKTNATNDYLYPVIMPKDTDEGAEITFSIDEESEVTVEIFKGSKSSNAEVTLAENVLASAGTYTVEWDGRDEDGKKLSKDTVYSYLVTARTVDSTSKKDKERGFFVVGYEGGVPGDDDEPVLPTVAVDDCGFWDVSDNSAYCEAIAWAKSEGIFIGDPDGQFRQYDFINRAEALAVALRAFEISVLPDDYTTLGFTDVTPGAWYMKYLRTGMFYGMIDGYGSSALVMPELQINRVEMLKYVLEGAETVGGYSVPVCNAKYYADTDTGAWYRDYICTAHDYNLYNTYADYFYPGNQVMRGEVALLLYRMNQGGLLK